MFAKNIVRSRGFVLVAGALAVSVIMVSSLRAQSGSAQVEDEKRTATAPPFVDAVPTDLSDEFLETERQLNNPFGDYFETPITDILDEIEEEFGVRWHLHESARENDLDADFLVTTPLQRGSIDENLHIILETRNCEYMITRTGSLVIASTDYLLETPLRVTYDVTHLPQSPEEIASVIQRTLKPGTWLANGGDGSVELLVSGGNKLLVISHTTFMHREIRQQLASIAKLSQYRIGAADGVGQAAGSSRSKSLAESREPTGGSRN